MGWRRRRAEACSLGAGLAHSAARLTPRPSVVLTPKPDPEAVRIHPKVNMPVPKPKHVPRAVHIFAGPPPTLIKNEASAPGLIERLCGSAPPAPPAPGAPQLWGSDGDVTFNIARHGLIIPGLGKISPETEEFFEKFLGWAKDNGHLRGGRGKGLLHDWVMEEQGIFNKAVAAHPVGRKRDRGRRDRSSSSDDSSSSDRSSFSRKRKKRKRRRTRSKSPRRKHKK